MIDKLSKRSRIYLKTCLVVLFYKAERVATKVLIKFLRNFLDIAEFIVSQPKLSFAIKFSQFHC